MSALRRLLPRVLPAGVLLLSLTLPAAAQEKSGTYSLQIDNDLFAGTDKHYTSGVRLDWISASDDLPPWLAGLASDLTLLPSPTDFRVGYTLGQNIYTPDDIKRSTAQRDDRPYAGWLYGGVGLFAEQGNTVDSIELKLGMVGPASLAEQTQKTVHKLIGSPRPRGWRHQLDNEPGIMIGYERQWQDALEVPLWGLCLDGAPRVGVVAGNVMTYAAAGGTMRFGKDLPDDFGPPLLRATSIGGAPRATASRSRPDDGCAGLTGPSGPGTESRWGWYLFGSLEARAVAHNIFLDGNTFGDSPSIGKKPLVADLQVGLVVYVDWLKLSYSRVIRTKEYDGQPAVDSFGSVGISVNF